MFYWVIWALLVSLWDIAYKKAVLVSENKISDLWYQFISWSVSLFLITLVYFWSILFWFQKYSNVFNFKVIWLLFLVWFISIFVSSLFAYAYKNEKLAVLAPYQESETIFTVLFWFLFFSNVSIESCIYVIIAWIILIIWSLDFKNLTFNKYAFAIIFWSFIYALKANLLALVLVSITPLDSLFYSNVFAFLCALSIITFKKETKTAVAWTDKKMLLYMNSESLTRLLVWFVYAFMVNEVWIIMTTLLWLLTIFSNMFFAYLVFKEVPAKKDYLVAFLVIVCIVLWTS